MLLFVASIYSMASIYDICYRKIPDILPASISVIGLAMVFANKTILEGVATLGLGAATFIALALLCMAGKLGGGDVKLLAASVLLVGANSFFDLFVLTALSGGVLSLVYFAAFLTLKALPASPEAGRAASGKTLKARLHLLWRIERRRILRRSSVPYGVAISGGSILSLTMLSV
jgi:prepilin peptidase CpaA